MSLYNWFRRNLISVLEHFGAFIPDPYYLRLLYGLYMGKPLDLNEPKTFNEKLQWLKLYYRDKKYTLMVDKIAVKNYVSTIIGERHIIPTICEWDDSEDISLDYLPERFVLKTTNGGGGVGVIVCTDKKNLNIVESRIKLKKALEYNIYKSLREWPYKDVPKKIFAEEYICDSHGELRDYKFFCFNGKVKFFKIDFDRFTDHHANYYDTDLHLLPFGEAYYPPKQDNTVIFPQNIQDMIVVAEKIASGLPFVRIDLYNIDLKIFFGEITFFPASGFGRFIPDSADLELGSYLVLPFA